MLTYERIENTERFPYAFIVKGNGELLGCVARNKRGNWEAGLPNGEPVARGEWSSRGLAVMALTDYHNRKAVKTNDH